MTADIQPDGSAPTTVLDVVRALERRYPTHLAASWDRVGLVVGEPTAPVRRILLVVDCVAETVAEAVTVGADLIVAHHPLLLRGVNSVATTSAKGSMVHTLIRAGVALFTAHTNADAARPGVTDALADRLGLAEVERLGDEFSPVRVGRLPEPMSLAELTRLVGARLPGTVTGVRAAGDPERLIATLALAGGAGDEFLDLVSGSAADAYLCADLRHHPASEHLARGGPALVEASHWATEQPWLDVVGAELRTDLRVDVRVSTLVTDVWTVRAPTLSTQEPKESRP